MRTRHSWGWKPAVRWGAAIGSLIVYDVHCAYGKSSHPTLSQVIREYAGHQHPVGKAVFLTGWAGLTIWFLPHIVGSAADAVEDAFEEARA